MTPGGRNETNSEGSIFYKTTGIAFGLCNKSVLGKTRDCSGLKDFGDMTSRCTTRPWAKLCYRETICQGHGGNTYGNLNMTGY